MRKTCREEMDIERGDINLTRQRRINKGEMDNERRDYLEEMD